MKFLLNIYGSSCFSFTNTFIRGVGTDYRRIFHQGREKAKRPEKLHED